MTKRKSGGRFRDGKVPTHSFTLIELMFAIAIMSVIVVVLLGLLSSMMTTWQFGQAKNERRAAGQAVLERMTRDLRQVALPLSRMNSGNLQFIINPSGVSANYKYPQAVFWQAPVATDGGTSGNMAIVGYFVQWANGAPALSRILINPSATSSYTIYSNPTDWITDALIQANASSTPAAGYEGLLADNILGLWVQALDPMGKPIQQAGGLAGENFDSRAGYSYTNSIYTTVASTNAASALPGSVQIAIVIIDSRTSKLLAGTEKPTSSNLTGNFWSDVQGFYNQLPPAIRKGAEIQTTTVDLSGGPR